MRTVGNVRQLMPGKMILSLQCGIANVANKSAFDSMRYHVLFNECPIWIGHLTLWATVQRGTVQSLCLANLTRLWAWFLLLWCLFLLLLATAGCSCGACCCWRNWTIAGACRWRFHITMMLIHIGVALHCRIAI